MFASGPLQYICKQTTAKQRQDIENRTDSPRLTESDVRSWPIRVCDFGEVPWSHWSGEYLSITLASVCYSVCPSICICVRPFACPSVRSFVCLSVYLFVCPSICPSVWLSVCPSVLPFFRSRLFAGSNPATDFRRISSLLLFTFCPGSESAPVQK